MSWGIVKELPNQRCWVHFRVPNESPGDERCSRYLWPRWRRIHRLLWICGSSASKQRCLQAHHRCRQNWRWGTRPLSSLCSCVPQGIGAAMEPAHQFLGSHSDMPRLKWIFRLRFWQVTRQVAKCKCAKRFQVEQIGDNKYRVSVQGPPTLAPAGPEAERGSRQTHIANYITCLLQRELAFELQAIFLTSVMCT